jgi:hypothetical protein
MTCRHFAEAIWRDLAFAARMQARSPTFTITVIVTLGMGLGLNSAIMSPERIFAALGLLL